MYEDFDDDHGYGDPDSGEVSVEQMMWVALPSATAVTGLAVGLLLGGLFGWSIANRPVTMEARVDVADIGELCADTVEDTQTALDDANHRVAALQDQVSASESRVATLEAEMTRRNKAGGALRRELDRAREELAQTKLMLASAEEEKERLIVELTRTEDKLVRTEAKLKKQVKATERAEEKALTNNWYRFLDESQLRVCERGNRKRLGNCRQRVLEILGRQKIRDKFSHCVLSDQATPEVEELGKDEDLPAYSYHLNRDDKFVKGWYLHLCDPTLPERSGFEVDPYDDGSLPTGFEFEEDDFAGLVD